MWSQLQGRSAPRVANTVPMSIVIVIASCASGIALVLMLIGIASAVRCRRMRSGRHCRTSGGASSKRPSVNAAMDFPELSPFDATDQDGEMGVAVPTSLATELVDCTAFKQPKQHRRGHVTMNGVKTPARARRSSDQHSVCTQPVLVVFTARPLRCA